MLVLASASPRRATLLAAAGIPFTVRAADVDESVLPGEAPRAYVRRVARAKAAAVVARLGPDAAVLAADTTVALGVEILGKPADPGEAAAMLRRLSGRTHQVHTAVALAVRGRVRVISRTTSVRFRALTAGDIARYVATGEPLDKAGGYGIQGEGGALVGRLSGSYTNVVGLPVEETLAMLETAGLRPTAAGPAPG